MDDNLKTIKDRIGKLLNLANNSGATEAEAETAMEMASALMLKYNIQVTVDNETDHVTVTQGGITMEGFAEAWHVTCASAAATLYICKVVRYPNYGVRFVGRPESIDACEQTYKYLIEQVEAQYKINLPRGMTKSDRAEYRRTFKFACSQRVYSRASKIIEQFRNNDAKALEYTGSKALVVVQSIDIQIKECQAFMDTLDLRKARSVSRRSGSGTHDGFKAAEKVNLNRKLG